MIDLLLAAGFVATALATPDGSTILGIGTEGILGVGARWAAALTLASLLVVGLGAASRSAAGTITTAVVVLFAPPILGALVSSEIVATRHGRRGHGREDHHPAPPRP